MVILAHWRRCGRVFDDQAVLGGGFLDGAGGGGQPLRVTEGGQMENGASRELGQLRLQGRETGGSELADGGSELSVEEQIQIELDGGMPMPVADGLALAAEGQAFEFGHLVVVEKPGLGVGQRCQQAALQGDSIVQFAGGSLGNRQIGIATLPLFMERTQALP